MMYFVLHTPPLFILHPEISLLFDSVSLKDKKAIPEIADYHACRMMVFKNSHYQCFIPALTESNMSSSQSHPQLNARGDVKYRNHFPYFFSSTPGPLPSISFSYANWQQLVPFALFIYLAETACSFDGTTSQS